MDTTGIHEGNAGWRGSAGRKALGWLGAMVVIAAPYIAGGPFSPTSTTRRGQAAETWVHGLQVMLGVEPSAGVARTVACWLLMALGLAALAGWFILGRTAGRPGPRTPSATPYGQAPPIHQDAPLQHPPGSHVLPPKPPETIDNPFNPPREQGPRRSEP